MPLLFSRKKKEQKTQPRVTTFRAQQEKQVADTIEAGLYPTRVASRKGVKLAQYLAKVAIGALLVVVLLSAFGLLDPLRNIFQPINSGTGTLIVSSDYVRTEVSLDGKILGQTPFTGESISAGKHVLKVRAAENTNNYFKESEVAIEISAGNTTIVKADPAPSTDLFSYTVISSKNRQEGDAQLIIKAIPQGVGIRIDGTEAGQTPYVTENLESGTHQVLLEKTGYKSVLLDITIVNDKVVTIESKLYQFQLNLEK